MDALTPAEHIRLWLRRAAMRVAVYLLGVGGEDALQPYGFLQEVVRDERGRVPEERDLFEQEAAAAAELSARESALPEDAPLPLLRLRHAGLDDAHLLALMLVGLVEQDARYGVVYAALHPYPEEMQMTAGLLDDLLRHDPATAGDGRAVVAELDGRGLVTLGQNNRPRSARVLSMPAEVWNACLGVHPSPPDTPKGVEGGSLTFHPRAGLTQLNELDGALPVEFTARLARAPELVAKRLITVLLLRGMRGSGRLRAMGGIAHALGRDLLHLRCPDPAQLPRLHRLAGPLAVMMAALPAVELELSPGETVDLPPVPGYGGLVGVLLNREGAVRPGDDDRLVSLEVPPPDVRARRAHWQRTLGRNDRGVDTGELADVASRSYHLTLGGIERAGRLAAAYAALDGREELKQNDIQEASRTLNQESLGTLAQRVPLSSEWDDLIVSPATETELCNLIRRCRHRETVLESLGRGFAGTTRGVRALFSGPSGTGKTLAARVIAAELGLDLYRVDLASVVSKYIGETERNLSQLFARAEEQDIILLLDEGDSLLTARTDVRNSTDRYANLETNYLLQRLENYEGIILVTSNAADRIDGAFQRRMDVVVEFGPPDAGQRRRLWDLHLPEKHGVSEPYLRAAALRCQLTGGQIRSVALYASVLAVEAEGPVEEVHVTEGLRREYAKFGAALPLGL